MVMMNTGSRRRQRTSSRRLTTRSYASSSFSELPRIITIAICAILAVSLTTSVKYYDSNHVGNNFLPMIFVMAIKPIRNLHVTYRGQTYTIKEGVSTVNELMNRFQHMNNRLGNVDNYVSPKGIVWKGQILRPDDDLSKAGIQHGDNVMILPGDKDAKPLDVLAIYLFLLSSNEKVIDEFINRMRRDNPESLESFRDTLSSVRDGLDTVSRKDVANFLRNFFDLSYHRLRSWWEHPGLRQGLHDPVKIESYRKVISTNLSAKILKKLGGGLQKTIASPELWRREFSKMATKAIRFGDTILEGILELLLDVLKGRGSSSYFQNGSNHFSTSPVEGPANPGAWGAEPSRNASNDAANSVTSEMEDPSLANNLLFELSESEEDSDLD